MIWKEKGESSWLITELDLKTQEIFKELHCKSLEHLGW